MSMVVLKSDALTVTKLDQETDVPIIKAQGAGPDTKMYPNSGAAPAGSTMPWNGGWKDGQGVRSNNAQQGRSAELPLGNGPVPGK